MKLPTKISLLSSLLFFTATGVAIQPGFGSGAGMGNQFGNPYGNQFGGMGGMGMGGMGGGMGMMGGGMGGGQMPDMSKLREAADATLKEGPKVQEKIEKAGEAFGKNVGEMTKNFSEQVANINKNSDEDSIKSGFEQIRNVTKTFSSDNPGATDTVNQMIKDQENYALARTKADQKLIETRQQAAAQYQLQNAVQPPPDNRNGLALVQGSRATNRPNSNLPLLNRGTGLGGFGNSEASGEASGNPGAGSSANHGRGIASETEKAYNMGGLGLH